VPVKKSDALRFGSVIHHGLDMAATKSEEEGIQEAIQYHKDHNIPKRYSDTSAEDWYEFHLDTHRIIATLSAYFWRWRETDEHYETIASEKEFEIPFKNGEYTLSGKIDKIVKLPSGDLAVREHKTTSDDLGPKSDYWRKLRIDSQISLYYIAAHDLGHPVSYVEYDVIRKPKIEPRWLSQAETRHLIDNGQYMTRLKTGADPIVIGEGYEVTNDEDGRTFVENEEAELKQQKNGSVIRETFTMFGHRLFQMLCHNHEDYFARKPIPRTASDLELFAKEIDMQAEMIEKRNEKNAWERNDSQCIVFGKCPYFYLCSEGFDPDSDPLPEGYTRERAHSELQETAA
jgi:hypothetical protein